MTFCLLSQQQKFAQPVVYNDYTELASKTFAFARLMKYECVDGLQSARESQVISD
jgi:hypothetical protein